MCVTAIQGATRCFYCPHTGYKDKVTGEFWFSSDGRGAPCFFRKRKNVVHLPGFEPKPKKARAKVDNGVAGACTCSKASGCKTKACPCFAAAKESKCTELCVGCVKHVKKCVGHLSLRG